ncbi:methionyl-tRNA formyltransferase [Endozoicomonas sp. SM1973]|uniref:Methionyl-tRNA formyltransferase n=1 Tax=Spartinivicinus marinus TaxID=2994442 RepID=A0A853IGP9_9GAMM|nr:methionyl-tRNA formyltransferase [Spartinivicinus marinus]MCX4026919.1 methionyl-tRNA formyltransferase [Spartinivicinus marinus]NYZ66736.1 methionyl-tRNA formyltransferase [Spartinivicinus marinus]
MSIKPLRIVFAGTPEFAAIHLQALLDSQHQVIAAYTQPDRPSGRGRKLTPSPVKVLAEAHQIPVFQPTSLKSEEAQTELASLNADVMVVVAYGLLLPKIILETPHYGCINVHASLLPKWRGAAPIQRAIAAGDKATGVTIMQMDVGLDTGDMLTISECEISDQETGGSLHDKLAEIGSPALLKTLQQIADGQLQPKVQDHENASYAHKLSKQEAHINWEQSATELDCLIRAFNPWPIAFTELDGQRIRVWEAKPLAVNGKSLAILSANSSDQAPGTIISANKEGLDIACGNGTLRITRLQLPNSKSMSVQELLNSRKEQFQPGVKLS